MSALPSLMDIEALERGLLERVREIVPEFDVVHFPQDGVVTTLHPQGTCAVRFGAFQPSEPEGRQSDRCVWTFEVNVVTRYLYSDKVNTGAYGVLSRLIAGLHATPLALDDGYLTTFVTLVDLVTVENGVWQYVVTVNIIAPYLQPRLT